MLDLLDAYTEISYTQWLTLWQGQSARGRSKSNFDKIRNGFLNGKVIEECNGKYKRYSKIDAEQSSFTDGQVA